MRILFETNICLYTNTDGHVVEGTGLRLRDC